MKLITVREQIRTVAARWKHQYGTNPSKWQLEVLKKLEMLDVEIATKENVAAIIGNPYWIASECDECGENFDVLVEFVDPMREDCYSVRICADCLYKALRSIRCETSNR